MTTAAVTTARTFTAIGTRWQIDVPRPLGADVWAAVDGVIDRFDRTWSRFRADALVTRLGEVGGSATLPDDAPAMLELYAELSEATGGAVNPLVGDALARRGYDATLSLRDHGPQSTPQDWQHRLTWTEGELRLSAPATIDVGAVGKGRLVDLVGAVIAAHLAPGADAFVVDASGDILVRGATERIALEHPYDVSRAIGIWEVTDAALCASAINRRAWVGREGVGLHHVLDARTGEPVREIAATWAVAADAMTADAAATALFFAGGEAFAAAHDAQWVRMTTSGQVDWSRGSTAELFT